MSASYQPDELTYAEIPARDLRPCPYQLSSHYPETLEGLNPITRTFPEPARVSAQHTARI